MLSKVTAQYRWFEGAAFDHEYYRDAHMRITRDATQQYGLIRLESEQAQWPDGAKTGQVVAATSVYFIDIQSARRALAAVGSALQADLVNYTNIQPEIRLALVISHPGSA